MGWYTERADRGTSTLGLRRKGYGTWGEGLHNAPGGGGSRGLPPPVHHSPPAPPPASEAPGPEAFEPEAPAGPVRAVAAMSFAFGDACGDPLLSPRELFSAGSVVSPRRWVMFFISVSASLCLEKKLRGRKNAGNNTPC